MDMHCYHDILLPKMKFHMKSLPALSFKRTCALNATSNESALIHFVSGTLYSFENLMPICNFISIKMTDVKYIPF